MLPDVPKNTAPTPVCMCGETMTHQEWKELAIEGGTRTVYGVACSTDGCPGNFPQVWKQSHLLDRLLPPRGEYVLGSDDITENSWTGVGHRIQESYIKPSDEYPMGSWMQKIDDEVIIATGLFEKEFPGHPSPYFHGGPPFVVIDTGDWAWDKESDGKTKAK